MLNKLHLVEFSLEFFCFSPNVFLSVIFKCYLYIIYYYMIVTKSNL